MTHLRYARGFIRRHSGNHVEFTARGHGQGYGGQVMGGRCRIMMMSWPG